MNNRTLGLGLSLVATVCIAVWYFSSPSPISPSEVGLGTVEQATTSTSTLKSDTAAPAPSAPKPAAVKKPAAPVTTNTQFCPKFTAGVKLGDRDEVAGSTGGVATLQIFLARTYGLKESTFVNGLFDTTTETYLKKYQQSVGLPQTGVTDYATQGRMLKPCLSGLVANGVEYPLKSVVLTTGSVTESLSIHQGFIEAGRTLANGAFRVEMISAGTSAKLRVTGLVRGGLQSQTVTLSKGGTVITENYPARLSITLTTLTSSGTTLYVSQM